MKLFKRVIKQKTIKISFIDTANVDPKYYPTPARKNLPQWYKEMEPHWGGKKAVWPEANISSTIKRCVPVLDMLTTGYIIYTPVDIYVAQIDGNPSFNWKSLNIVDFHGPQQLGKHPYYNMNNGASVPKINSPWGIETEKGYSCLFMNPPHRENRLMHIFEGIVDTDSYNLPVNFPFVLTDPSFEGIIPAGTPVALVIPFKRESFKYEAYFAEKKDELQNQNRNMLSHYFDVYRKNWWTSKNFD